MSRGMKAMRFLMGAILALGLVWTSAAQTLKLPPHEKGVLKNGLTLLLMEKHGVPMVSVAAIVKARSVADPAGREGHAALTAGLMRQGTRQRNRAEVFKDSGLDTRQLCAG